MIIAVPNGPEATAARLATLRSAITHLQAALTCLDAAQEARAAIHVSHALALVDGSGGAWSG